MKLDVSVLADKDLENIFDYTLERWGYNQAQEYLGLILEIFNVILGSPKIGAKQPRMGTLRKLRAEHHMVYYIVGTNNIEIVRVLHKSADFKSAFD